MDSQNPVSPNLVTPVPQLRGYKFVEFDQYYSPKYFIEILSILGVFYRRV
jgi:hypothetical protein